MKKAIKVIMLALAIVMISRVLPSQAKSDSYIRNRIVRLKSEQGMCSGEQVRTTSGKDYILTAAHCGLLAKDGMFHVILEDGSTIERRFIAEDDKSDLILIEGLPNLRGLDIAQLDARFEKIRTFSHGHDYDTYTTEGVIIQDTHIQVMLHMIMSPSEMQACRGAKYKVGYIYEIIPVCYMDITETATTAQIVPGSSGGAAVNAHGDLIGVNSAGNEAFSFLVTLQDIKGFLSDK